MRFEKTIALAALVTAAMALPGTAWAGDVVQDMRSSQPDSNRENGGFLELGIDVGAARPAAARNDPDDDGNLNLTFNLFFSGGYQYERLFVEATESWFGGLNLGVNVLESQHWSVDVLLANIAGRVTVDNDDPPPPVTEAEKNHAILERDSLSIAAGTRITGYYGDNLIQLRLVSDWYEGNGLSGSARYGRQWQLGNWNLQGILGVRFNSAQYNDYLFGVDAIEASERFPVYKPGNAWIPELELAASLPLSKNWVYTSRFRVTSFPDSVTDSPLMVEDHGVFLNTGIHYVF